MPQLSRIKPPTSFQPYQQTPPLHPETKRCFEGYARRIPAPFGAIPIQVYVSNFNTLCRVGTLTTRWLSAKTQRMTEGMKIFLDVAKESADWFPPLKSALNGVSSLINHYEVLVKYWVSYTANTGGNRNSRTSRRELNVLYLSSKGSNRPSPP